MKFSKVLLALMVGSVAAKGMTTYVGAGIRGGYKSPRAKTSKNIISEAGVKSAPLAGKQFETKDTGEDFALNLKSNDDVKGFIPGGAFVSVAANFDNLVGAMSLGFGLDLGIDYNFNYKNEGWYGEEKNPTTKNTNFAIKFPKWSFYATPKFLIGFDVASIHLMLSLGLEASYSTFKVKLNGGGTKTPTTTGFINSVEEADAKVWLFGVKAGLEGIYQISDCAGVGLGLHLTYWPEAMNSIKTKDLAKKFNKNAEEKAKVFHVGGMWSVTGSLTGWFAFGA